MRTTGAGCDSSLGLLGSLGIQQVREPRGSNRAAFQRSSAFFLFPKVRFYILCLQVLRIVIVRLLKSFGCSFRFDIDMTPSDHVMKALLTQNALSRFFSRFACRRHFFAIISRLIRNKIAHRLPGNTYSRKGLGKGKTKNVGQQPQVDEDELFRQEIRSAMPDPASL